MLGQSQVRGIGLGFGRGSGTRRKLVEGIESLSGVCRELTKGIEGLRGVRRKLAEGIRSLSGVRRELIEGIGGLQGVRRELAEDIEACWEFIGSLPKVIGSLPGWHREFIGRRPRDSSEDRQRLPKSLPEATGSDTAQANDCTTIA
ncbi:hypothetical protein B296_00002550 [Ensete ventricosum]|uniref:Uncharacterized protein n=1 Tax=Ensete ventricosum TaxID=4639 RepID=A0A426ZQE4_ENSVE|nr:hypothetical protein B296_00002550 [Ensete ventricosum]